MKATELQIGDWVIFHDSGYASDGTTWEEDRICQIDSIDEDVRVKWYDESGCEEDWPHVSTELLSPIPLTSEILEKNGFEKQWQDNYEYFDDDENLNVTFHPKTSNYTNGAYDYIDIEKGCLTINEMPIMFVHELQHALRLCGITREIIL